MKEKIFFSLLFILASISTFAQKFPDKEVVFQVQNASATDTITFKYENKGTPYLFDENNCTYEEDDDFNFTYEIIDDYTDIANYAHIILDNDYPLTIGEMIHCLLKITVSWNGIEARTFEYDIRDCQYYTPCDGSAQDITLRYDVGNNALWLYEGGISGGTASEGNGWEPVDDASKTYWDIKGISHCPLDFAGAPDTPANFAVSGTASENPQLDWDDNDEPDLIGYYLYRNYQGSAFLLFDSVTAPTNTYTDVDYTITNSRFDPIVCYKVTAYDEEYLESSQTSQGCRNVVADKRMNYSNSEELFKEYKLYRAYPNPFNPSTRITFQIPKSGHVNLSVSDVNGRLVETLISESKPEGLYNITFDAKNLSSGIYYYTLRTSDFISTKKMLFVK